MNPIREFKSIIENGSYQLYHMQDKTKSANEKTGDIKIPMMKGMIGIFLQDTFETETPATKTAATGLLDSVRAILEVKIEDDEKSVDIDDSYTLENVSRLFTNKGLPANPTTTAPAAGATADNRVGLFIPFVPSSPPTIDIKGGGIADVAGTVNDTVINSHAYKLFVVATELSRPGGFEVQPKTLNLAAGLNKIDVPAGKDLIGAIISNGTGGYYDRFTILDQNKKVLVKSLDNNMQDIIDIVYGFTRDAGSYFFLFDHVKAQGDFAFNIYCNTADTPRLALIFAAGGGGGSGSSAPSVELEGSVSR